MKRLHVNVNFKIGEFSYCDYVCYCQFNSRWIERSFSLIGSIYYYYFITFHQNCYYYFNNVDSQNIIRTKKFGLGENIIIGLYNDINNNYTFVKNSQYDGLTNMFIIFI